MQRNIDSFYRSTYPSPGSPNAATCDCTSEDSGCTESPSDAPQIHGSPAIRFTFFDAVDKYIVRCSEVFGRYSPFLSKLWRGREMKDTQLACFASHFMLWRTCVSTGKPMVIIEDDVDFMPYFRKGVEDCYSSPYDFVKIAMSSFNNMTLISDNFAFSPKLVLGSTGYYVTPRGAANFIRSARLVYLPLDDYIGNAFLSGNPTIVYLPKLVEVNGLNDSSIINGLDMSDAKKLGLGFSILKEAFRLCRNMRRLVFNIIAFSRIRPHFTNDNLP